MTRSSGRSALSGILNVDKPLGLTSHDVVDVVRRLSGQRRVGHTGTLDPLATGVLVVCLGKATRVSAYLMASTKRYHATVRLGVTTTTDDAEGDIVREADVTITRPLVKAALESFVGRIEQVPPTYSALKRGGKRLYHLARQGIAVDVAPREVEIHRLELSEWRPPIVGLDVECGPGTYIRALARDLGEALGCGAHLASLRRTRSGRFAIERACTLEQLEGAFSTGTEARFLQPLDVAFEHLPALHLSADLARRIVLGQEIEGREAAPEALQARAYAPGGKFIALLSREDSRVAWKPRKVFARPEEIAPLESGNARTDQRN